MAQTNTSQRSHRDLIYSRDLEKFKMKSMQPPEEPPSRERTRGKSGEGSLVSVADAVLAGEAGGKAGRRTAVKQNFVTQASNGIVASFNQVLGGFKRLGDRGNWLKIVVITAVVVFGVVYFVSATVSPKTARKESVATFLGYEGETRSDSDIEHYTDDRDVAQVKTAVHTEPSEPVKEEVVESQEEVALPEAPADEEAEVAPRMLVYKSASDSKMTATISKTVNGFLGKGDPLPDIFTPAMLRSSVEASSLGGYTVVAELADGSILYGKAGPAAPIDRVFISFDQRQLPDGSRERVGYTAFGNDRGEGLPADCSTISKQNLGAKGIKVAADVLAAAGNIRSSGPLSASDISRNSVAEEVRKEADFYDRSGNVRSCKVNQGTPFFVVGTQER